MAATKPKYNVEEVELTFLVSGDMDNRNAYSYLNDNLNAKSMYLKQFLRNKHALDDVIDLIFSDSISKDQFIKISMALTLYDAILTLSGRDTSPVTSANDLYFALLVNFNVSEHKAYNPIRSYSALNDAKDLMDNLGRELDYREYILNSDAGKTARISVVVKLKNFSSDIILELPIIKLRLGFFRLDTSNHMSARMKFLSDSSSMDHMVPSFIWLGMIEQNMLKRKTTKFGPFESKRLSKLFNIEDTDIIEILVLNNYIKLGSIPAMYDTEADSDGILTILHTDDPPELFSNGLEWVPKRANTYWLKSHKFYLVYFSRSITNIYAAG